jgi:hypothetical protein
MVALTAAELVNPPSDAAAAGLTAVTPRPTSTPLTPSVTPTSPGTTSTTTTAGAPPPANPNLNCTIIVPPNPTSPAGLATPYRLKATDPTAGPCHEANADQSAFVEAAVIGYQADVLTFNGAQGGVRNSYFHRRGLLTLDFGGARGGVNGLPGNPLDCNAPAFFAIANAAIRGGRLAVPPLGTGTDGLPCPTTRDFGIVDQDQSDNLPGKYLATADGHIAQFSPANQAALPGATMLSNASDNGIVDNKWDPIVGCHPWQVPDLSQNGAFSPGLALNELQAAAFQAPPAALVPVNDPMTLDGNGDTSVTKTNLYRFGVNLPAVGTGPGTGDGDGDGATYCTHSREGSPITDCASRQTSVRRSVVLLATRGHAPEVKVRFEPR